MRLMQRIGLRQVKPAGDAAGFIFRPDGHKATWRVFENVIEQRVVSPFAADQQVLNAAQNIRHGIIRTRMVTI